MVLLPPAPVGAATKDRLTFVLNFVPYRIHTAFFVPGETELAREHWRIVVDHLLTPAHTLSQAPRPLAGGTVSWRSTSRS